MFKSLFHTEQQERQDALDKLIQHSSPRRDFFILTLLSVIMACAGLATDNVVYILASMLIAPVLYPLLSLSMGIVAMDAQLIGRSAIGIVASFSLVITAAAAFGFMAGAPDALGLEIARRLAITPYEWVVAIVAGFAASLSVSKTQLNEALPGVAVAVSIVPPLSVIGLGLAWVNADMVGGGATVLLTNAFAIVAASIIIFAVQGFFKQRKATNKALERESQLT